MSFKTDKTGQKFRAVIFSAMLIISMVGGVALFAGSALAATATMDNESTDTASTSDILSQSNITAFEASSNNSTYIEASFDSALDGEAKIAILDPETASNKSEMDAVYTNSSAVTTNSTTNNKAWNVSHDELSNLPIEANENKTFYLKVWDTGDTSNATYVKFYIEATGERSVLRVAAYNIGDNKAGTITKTGFTWMGLGAKDTEFTYEKSNVAMDGANTSVSIFLDNKSATKAATSAFEEKSAGAWSDEMILSVTDENGNTVYVPVFNSEKASWNYLDSTDAYATFNGDDEVTFHANGDSDFDEVNNTDITLKANKQMSLSQQKQMFQSLGADNPFWKAVLGA